MRANCAASARASRARTRSSPSARRSPRTCARARRSSPSTRLEVIPNPVDVAGLRADAAAHRRAPLPGPYALYLGKLAPNKGTSHLVGRRRQARARLAARGRGDGPDRERDRSGGARDPTRDIRFIGWVDQAAAAAWLAHASTADLPVARTGVAQPRAASKPARSACRSRPWTPAARPTSSRTRHRPAVRDAGGAGRRRPAARATTRRCGGGWARRRGGALERVRCRVRSSRASKRSTRRRRAREARRIR